MRQVAFDLGEPALGLDRMRRDAAHPNTSSQLASSVAADHRGVPGDPAAARRWSDRSVRRLRADRHGGRCTRLPIGVTATPGLDARARSASVRRRRRGPAASFEYDSRAWRSARRCGTTRGGAARRLPARARRSRSRTGARPLTARRPGAGAVRRAPPVPAGGRRAMGGGDRLDAAPAPPRAPRLRRAAAGCAGAAARRRAPVGRRRPIGRHAAARMRRPQCRPTAGTVPAPRSASAIRDRPSRTPAPT